MIADRLAALADAAVRAAESDEDLSRFVSRCYEDNWVLSDFDWSSWGNDAKVFTDDPRKLESIDIETLCKILTGHVRYDRFCEGHLAAVAQSGFVAAIGKRAQAMASKLRAGNSTP